MGGNKKEEKSQRTKGNTKPSSSARSAALLTSTNTSGFIGFGDVSSGETGAAQPGFVPVAGLEDLDSSGAYELPGDIRMTLRKMGKKDVTTRLKAVQEFQSICVQSSDRDCIKVLPFWPRIYNKLAFDHDRRVREGAQKVLASLAEKLSRNLAPHLKTLMPSWFLSTFDPYPPVSSAAKLALSSAFNGKEDKQKEAIRFCRKEVESLIEDNILHQTPETMSDPRSSAPEDIQAKYDRVISATLQAYAAYIGIVPEKDLLANQRNFHTNLISNTKFWKMSNHKTAMIRSSWFVLVCAICQNFPETYFLESNDEKSINLGKKLGTTIFSNLDSKDPQVLEAVWDAALVYTNKCQKWYQVINLKKLVIPKLEQILRKGAAGNGIIIYPKLLPLLGHFPRDPSLIMIEPLLKTLIDGLYLCESENQACQEEPKDEKEEEELKKSSAKNKANLLSFSEKKRGIDAFFECVLFSMANFSQENHALLGQVFSLIEKCLNLEVNEADSKAIFSSFTRFLKLSFGRKSENVDKVLGGAAWAQFEGNIKDLFVTYSSNANEPGLNRINSLLVALWCQAEKSSVSSNKKLRFQSHKDDLGPNDCLVEVDKSESVINSTSDSSFGGKICNLCSSVCCLALQNFEDTRNPVEIGFVLRTLRGIRCKEQNLCFFQQMCSHFNLIHSEDNALPNNFVDKYPSLRLIWHQVVKNIVLNQGKKGKLYTFYPETAILTAEVVLSSTSDVPTEVKVNFFQKVMSEMLNLEFLETFVQNLCQKKANNEAVRIWLASPKVGAKMAAMIGELAKMYQADKRDLDCDKWRLCQLLFQNADFVSESHLSSILASFTLCVERWSGGVEDVSPTTVKTEDGIRGNQCLFSYLCQLLLSLQNCNQLCWQVEEAKQVVHALFKLQCFSEKDSLSSENVSSQVHSIWVLGLKSFQSYMDVSTFYEYLALEMADVIQDRLFRSDFPSDLDFVLDNVTQMAVDVLEFYSGTNRENEQGDKECMEQLLLQMLPEIPELETYVEKAVLHEKLHLVIAQPGLSVLNPEQIFVDIQTAGHYDLEASRILVFASFFARITRQIWNSKNRSLQINLRSKNAYPTLDLNEEDNYHVVFEKPAKQLQEQNINISETEEKRFTSLPLHWQSFLNLLVHFYRTLCFIQNFPEKSAEKCLRNKIWQERCSQDGRYLLEDILPLKMSRKILNCLLKRGINEGFGWARSASDFITLLQRVDNYSLDMNNILDNIDQAPDGIGKIHMLQVLMPYIGSKEIHSIYETEIARLQSFNPTEENEFVSLLPDINICLAKISCCISQLPADGDESHHDCQVVLETIGYLRKAFDGHFLYDCSLEGKTVQWTDVVFVRNVCQVMTEILKKNIQIQAEHWDLILCSTSSWTQTFDESKSSSLMTNLSEMDQNAIQVTLFSEKVLHLVSALGQVMMPGTSAASSIQQDTLDEWKEFFSDGIFSSLLPTFVQIASSLEEACSDLAQTLITSLGSALQYIPDNQLFNHGLEPKFLVEDVDCQSVYQDELTFLLNHLTPLMTQEKREVQVTVYQLLNRVMEKLADEDEKRDASSLQGRLSEDNDRHEPPRRLCDLLSKTQPIMEKLFLTSDFDFGELIPIPELTWAQNYTRSYLLTWKLLLTYVSCLQNQMRPKLSEFIRQECLMDFLMPTLFHLFTGTKSVYFGTVHKEPEVNTEPLDEVHLLACQVYLGLLKYLPAMVRQWWNSSEKRISDIVEKLTVSQVTPHLWAEEMKAINSSNISLDNMTIRVRPSVREVLAVYTVDDGSMELVIQLPNNFPLGAVKVDSGRRVGVGTSQWRNWMLQLTTFLQHQNGSILDGLVVWKQNVDKRFEGVEECYICFYILHGANHQLPKLACRTCKKKFHSACLYKWFSTSNNSTCPLCRNLF